MYLHATSATRSHGCRARGFQSGGHSLLCMENSRIRVVFALSKGTDILEFVHKPSDTDFMWHSFQPLRAPGTAETKAAGSGSFLEHYAGGWQELFPTYGAPAAYYGAEMGTHGEACLYPWEHTVLADDAACVSVRFTLRTRRSPFVLEKTVTLKEGDLHLSFEERVTSEASRPLDFMWGHHPAFGHPFLSGSVRLEVDGTPKVKVFGEHIWPAAPFGAETEGDWPLLPGKNGAMVDMGRACSAESKTYMEYCLHTLQSGRYRLVNPEKRLGFEMNWELARFPYLWIWGMYGGAEGYPWYGRAYTMGVEPWSSLPGDYARARAAGQTIPIEPGQTIETAFTAGVVEDVE